MCGALTGLSLMAYEKYQTDLHTIIGDYITSKGQLVNFDNLVSNGQLEFMLNKKLASVMGGGGNENDDFVSHTQCDCLY